MRYFLSKIFLITAIITSCNQQLSATTTSEIDVMDMPGIFRNINMAKVPEFCAAITAIKELTTTPVKRFFDLLSFRTEAKEEYLASLRATPNLASLSDLQLLALVPDDNLSELMRNQLAYHLVTLTALGQKISEDLVEGEYAWVLDSDKSTYDHPAHDLVYEFFTNLENTDLRQLIWDTARTTGFIESDITDVRRPFYDCGTNLRTLIDDSSEPVEIIIGGNSIPIFYKTVNPKCSGDYKHPATHAFGSSCYKNSYQQGYVTIGVDHRHRPRALANAYNPELWRSVPWEKVKAIRYEYINTEKLKAAIPASAHEKLIEHNDFSL